MANFSNVVHAVGRYPELIANSAFLDWIRKYGSEIWHEAPTENHEVSVVFQSKDRLQVFAALVKSSVDEKEFKIQSEILKVAEFDLAEVGFGPVNAAVAARKNLKVSSDKIKSIKPRVDFTKAAPTLTWEVEIANDDNVQSFSLIGDKLNAIGRYDINKNEPFAKSQMAPPASDWLEENECHHLTSWRSLAQSIVGGAQKPADKAFAIWLYVRRRMFYDATITNISEFTWSDNLVINQNNWRGICDEWAVVQITLLRAVGVPATLKFLIWQDGNETVGHACLEWSDNGAWKHMDALWNAFDNRAIYRQSGARNLTVMDGTSPMDSRYNGLAWGVLDIQGDQKFYPYGDFIINPGYPGNQRPGFSY